jgi:diaminopimelate decarboxylase
LEQVAEKFGTPLYVYSAGTILDHYRRLNAALSEIDHLICYAVKANSNRSILRLLAQEGAGFDIVSGGELFRVRAAGGDPQKCTFAGVGKSEEEIADALDQRVLSFNVESEAELIHINRIAGSKGMRAPIAIRVNPDVETRTHRYISTGRSENKFGIGLNRVADVYAEAAKMPNIVIRGVQMHIGSQITDAAPFAEAVAKVTPLVLKLKEQFGLQFFSIGGGIGIIYESSFASGSSEWWNEKDRVEATTTLPLTIHDYATAILPTLRTLGLRVLLEPGRLLVGNAGVLLTRVSYIKQAEHKKFVIVDAE